MKRFTSGKAAAYAIEAITLLVAIGLLIPPAPSTDASVDMTHAALLSLVFFAVSRSARHAHTPHAWQKVSLELVGFGVLMWVFCHAVSML